MAYAPTPTPVAPPTIAFLKSQGVTATRVFCASIYCGRMVVVDFDDLGLPNDTLFPSIKARRRWTCQRCGNREVSVMPNWHNPRAVHAERMTTGTEGAYGVPAGGLKDGLLHLVQHSRAQIHG